ncbi:signal peptidase II [bacterium]|nr:signal peptidase II [bacterium]
MARKKQPQNLWIKITYLFAIFAVLVCLNLYLSDFIVQQIQGGLTINNEIFSLNYTQNKGAAFSLLHNYPYILIVLSVAALVILFSYIIRHAGTMSYNGIFWLTLMMSGIFCNLFERVQLGYVRDYIDLNFVNFPVFNLSDMSINIGVFVIIILLLKRAQLKQL